MGSDMVLADDTSVAILPRTTKITTKIMGG
jgi:hypothetical protein